MFGVTAEFQDVPLGQAKVFEQHPEGMGITGGLLAAKAGGDVGDNGVEGGVGVTALQEFKQMLAKGVVVVGHKEL